MTDADADADAGVTHFRAYHRPPDGHFLILMSLFSTEANIQKEGGGVFPWNWIPESGKANVFIADGEEP